MCIRDSSSSSQTSSSSSSTVTTGVNTEFFDNTAFVGDSRVEGLSYYCGSDIPGASFFTSRGIMLDGVTSKKVITTTGGQQLTLSLIHI